MTIASNSVFSSLIWKFSERILAQGVSFIVSLVLARLLAVEDYGIIAMVLIFINIADVFVTSGFSTALIQKKNSSETDFSTIFYCSLITSIFIYGLIFALAPLIAKFYNTDILTKVLRIFALRIPLSVYNTVQHAYVSRHMMFKRFFFSTLFGTILSGIVGIVMAYAGFGVWALVAQYFTNTIVDTMVLAFTVPWRPRLLFSWSSAKSLMNYGSKILLADLSGTFFGQLRSFVIGKVYTSADLAFYNKGQQLPSLLTNNISSSIMTVLFPAISNKSDNLKRVKEMSKKSIQIISYVLFPVLAGLSAVAEPLILLLYTDKWLPCIPFLNLLCLSSAVDTLTVISLQTIKAIGRSDAVLKIEFIKKPIYVALLFIGAYKGVIAIAITAVIYEFYGTFINMVQLKKYIGYGLKEQLSDLRPATIMTLIMASAVKMISLPTENQFVIIIVKILCGIGIYMIATVIIKPAAIKYIYSLLKRNDRYSLAKSIQK